MVLLTTFVGTLLHSHSSLWQKRRGQGRRRTGRPTLLRGQLFLAAPRPIMFAAKARDDINGPVGAPARSMGNPTTSGAIRVCSSERVSEEIMHPTAWKTYMHAILLIALLYLKGV